MNARNQRGVLTMQNILEACITTPYLVFEQLQEIIDAPDVDIPDESTSAETIRKLQSRQAYFSNQYPYLVGLWGVIRMEAGTDKHLIAMRDYLEKVVSACSKKYDGASRVLTGHQAIMEENKGVRLL